MTTVSRIYNFIDFTAPFNTAMDFDNVGLLVGDRDAEVTRAVVSLDITAEVVQEAVKLGAQLIISHHPVIFNPLKSLQADSVPYLLASSHIAAICAHTNLDIAPSGVNTCLAEALGLSNIKYHGKYAAITGKLDRTLTAKEFAQYVKKSLSCKGLRYTECKKSISDVAVCCGAGGDFVYDAVALEADAFVTGEIKHHEILFANAHNMCVVDAGHYKTEDIVIDSLIKRLRKTFMNVDFRKSEVFSDKMLYI